MYYQPRVGMNNKRVVGVEALLRWHSPELGEVSPAQFIGSAEVTGLIVPIGDWVLRTACRQLRAWREAGAPPLIMGVNVSARQFRQPDLVQKVAAVLSENNLPPGALELELTESLLVHDMESTHAKMTELKNMGVGLALDDFGTGYSSLNYLRRFPLTTLKVDQSFVRNISYNRHDLVIAAMVISLARQLGMKTVAEGVELREQLLLLETLNCQDYQGYYFCKPQPAAALAPLLFTGVPEAVDNGAPIPADEADRLAALNQYQILDTLPEQVFDDIVELAAQICGTRIALISLVDRDRQWFKAKVGLNASQTPRNVAFCAHAILQPEMFMVPDAREDARFANNPLVTDDPQIRFYAGVPLINVEGHALGTLCTIDTVPRELDAAQQNALRVLARHVMAQLELRRRQMQMTSTH